MVSWATSLQSNNNRSGRMLFLTLYGYCKKTSSDQGAYLRVCLTTHEGITMVRAYLSPSAKRTRGHLGVRGQDVEIQCSKRCPILIFVRARPNAQIHPVRRGDSCLYDIYSLLSSPARCSSPGQCASGHTCLIASQMCLNQSCQRTFKNIDMVLDQVA
jgi:hypothetical protein